MFVQGGDPGFVHVVDERTIAFPVYNGNGMFLSAGNILVNAQVGLTPVPAWKQREWARATLCR